MRRRSGRRQNDEGNIRSKKNNYKRGQKTGNEEKRGEEIEKKQEEEFLSVVKLKNT